MNPDVQSCIPQVNLGLQRLIGTAGGRACLEGATFRTGLHDTCGVDDDAKRVVCMAPVGEEKLERTVSSGVAEMDF